MINLTIGLLVFMGVNILLGSVDSLFNGQFDKTKFLKGFGKALVVVGCYVAVYYAGTLNSDIIVMKINDVDVNMVTGIQLTVIGGYVAYGKQIIEKLGKFMVPKE